MWLLDEAYTVTTRREAVAVAAALASAISGTSSSGGMVARARSSKEQTARCCGMSRAIALEGELREPCQVEKRSASRRQASMRGTTEERSPDEGEPSMDIGIRAYAAFERIDDSLTYAEALLYSAAFWLAVALFWAIVLLASKTYRTMDAPVKAECVSYVNSSIHALHACITSLYVVFGEEDLYEGKPMATLSFWRGALLFTMGYFLADCVIVLLFFKRFDRKVETLLQHVRNVIATQWGSVAHHACALLTAHWVLHEGSYFAQLWIAGTEATELSTFFVNMRWFASHTLRRDSGLYVVIGLTMMVTFVTTRLVLYPAFLIWMFQNPALEQYGLPDTKMGAMLLGVTGAVATTTVSLLNVYWSYRMILGAVKILFGKGKSTGKSTSVSTSSEQSGKKDL
ncbi:Transmembrane protein 56-A [Porphyridium purpureum]|uniref:Transmembrane protein 56-A n=1 Tax=Porphyridium purpureum TaxID=35688 RepID=A0A5J4ZA03_PORPP|nr:Transmembrane protein 56-A [Porphyridium purpureum]|eukprot:POR7399..scf295_1